MKLFCKKNMKCVGFYTIPSLKNQKEEEIGLIAARIAYSTRRQGEKLYYYTSLKY